MNLLGKRSHDATVIDKNSEILKLLKPKKLAVARLLMCDHI